MSCNTAKKTRSNLVAELTVIVSNLTTSKNIYWRHRLTRPSVKLLMALETAEVAGIHLQNETIIHYVILITPTHLAHLYRAVQLVLYYLQK